MDMDNLTYDDIRKAPTSYLRKCLKEDLDVDIIDMITHELFDIREPNGEIMYWRSPHA